MSRLRLGALGRGLLLALSALGVLVVGGAFSRTLDLLTHAAPLFVVLGVLAVALAIRARPLAMPLMVAGAACALANLWLVVPDLASRFGPEAAAAPDRQIKILTQNLWRGNTNHGQTVAAIEASGAEIVVLQEGRDESAAIVAELAKVYPYHANCLAKNEWCYMAILSRRPIVDWSYHVADWRPPNYDRMGLVRATIVGPGGRRFEVIGTHLIHPDPKGEGQQQAEQTIAAVHEASSRDTIFAGDFNRVPWSFSLRRIDSALPFQRRTHFLATWPQRLPIGRGGIAFPFPFLPIDHIYAGSDWRLVDVRRVNTVGSDHAAVLATLVLNP